MPGGSTEQDGDGTVVFSPLRNRTVTVSINMYWITHLCVPPWYELIMMTAAHSYVTYNQTRPHRCTQAPLFTHPCGGHGLVCPPSPQAVCYSCAGGAGDGGGRHPDQGIETEAQAGHPNRHVRILQQPCTMMHHDDIWPSSSHDHESWQLLQG